VTPAISSSPNRRSRRVAERRIASPPLTLRTGPSLPRSRERAGGGAGGESNRVSRGGTEPRAWCSVAPRSTLALGFGFLYAPIVLTRPLTPSRVAARDVWAGSRPAGTANSRRTKVSPQPARTQSRSGRDGGRAWRSCGDFRGFQHGAVLGVVPADCVRDCLVDALVVPEVILGLSLLVLFVAAETLIGWPQGRAC